MLLRMRGGREMMGALSDFRGGGLRIKGGVLEIEGGGDRNILLTPLPG